MRPFFLLSVIAAGVVAAAGCGSSKSATTAAKPVNSAASQHALEQARAQDRTTQSDLRNALTAEKTWFTDNMTYTDTIAELKQIESSLVWGAKPRVYVSDDKFTVCLDEASESGTVFSIADIADGPHAGTFYGKTACPIDLSTVSAMSSTWQTQAEQNAPKGDRAIQSDLRNALTAEKVIYTDSQAYDATVSNLKAVEPSLDWGGKLGVHVSSDSQSVCLDETSSSGTTFYLADIGVSKRGDVSYGGTYYGKVACPKTVTPEIIAALGGTASYSTSW